MNLRKFGSMRLIVPMLALVCVTLGVIADEVTPGRLALRKLSERAANGEMEAIYELAKLHDIGYDSIEVDSARSTALYRVAAEKGFAPARNYLGFRYFNGEYVRQNVDSALYWLVKAAAAGDASAANNLGYLLSNSDVVSRDYPQAIHWLKIASEAGLPSAQSMLADLLRQGLGTEPDTVSAENLYTKAIVEGGLHDAELKLLNMMGRKWEAMPGDSVIVIGRYFYSHGGPIIGIAVLEDIAPHDNPDVLALLGDAYSRGVGVPYDHDKSITYFLNAALLGNPSAQFVIGELLDILPDSLDNETYESVLEDYFDKENIPSDIFTAPYWYEKAAESGIIDAESAANALLSP